MCKKHNLEQALRGLSLIINPLCNTVALQSMAPLLQWHWPSWLTQILCPWISVPPFIAVKWGLKSPGAKYRFLSKTSNSDILATEDDFFFFYNYSWFSKQLMSNAVHWERMWQHPRIYTRYEGGTKVQFITDWAQRVNGSYSLFDILERKKKIDVDPGRIRVILFSFLPPLFSLSVPGFDLQRRDRQDREEESRRRRRRICGFHCCHGNRV